MISPTLLQRGPVLMEGALGERLKREFGLLPDKQVALAAHVYSGEGRRALEQLWEEYLQIAQEHGLPFLATTPTRRVNAERVAASRYGESIIAHNILFLKEFRQRHRADMLIGALVGCRGDAYSGSQALPEEEAQRFHSWELERFAACGANLFFAGILPTLPEAAGLSRAAAGTGVPYIVSFMLRRDGRLPDGTPLHDAIACIDDRVAPAPLCYMTNCVHPDILYDALSQPFNRTDLVDSRFRGIQANASPLAPEELDSSIALRQSSPDELARAVLRLEERITLGIVGGCCGTDATHMRAIAHRLCCI